MREAVMALWEIYCIISAVFIVPSLIFLLLLYWRYKRKERRYSDYMKLRDAYKKSVNSLYQDTWKEFL